MSRLLLDTTALSALFRGREDIAAATRAADRLAISPISLGELNAGFRGGERQQQNSAILARFLASPRVRTLVIEPETAERYALIYDALRRAGTPIPTNDVWIAANAMQFGLRVITTDGHFARVPQIVVELFPA